MNIPRHIYDLYAIFGDHPVVSTDTRNIAPGSIFFALHGGNFDGNAFAGEALRKGAAWVVADDRAAVQQTGRTFFVDDTLEALQQLACLHRRGLDIPVLAITGSNGKTTTKELVSRVLARRYAVSVTRGNLNNHIGVPLTLLAMTGETEFAVVEMGASSCGEIALLCDMAQPGYGMITNIGKSHLEGFGGEEGVRRGKGEMFDYLAAHGGTAFYPSGDGTLPDMAAQRGDMRSVGYGTCPAAADDGTGLVSFVYRGATVRTHLAGEYNIHNISAAVAVGEHFGIAPAEVSQAIADYDPDNNRSQIRRTARNTVIMDCYNANPSSMSAALENLSREASALPKAVILGDMFELGSHAAGEHGGIVRLAEEKGFSRIILVGGNFASTPRSPSTVALRTKEELAEYLARQPLSGHLVLLKGSRAMGLETIAGLL